MLSDFETFAILWHHSNHHHHHHHHHHDHVPGWRVAVSTRCFQRARPWAYLHAEVNPSCVAASLLPVFVARCDVALGSTPPVIGHPVDWHFESTGEASIHGTSLTEHSANLTESLYAMCHGLASMWFPVSGQFTTQLRDTTTTTQRSQLHCSILLRLARRSTSNRQLIWHNYSLKQMKADINLKQIKHRYSWKASCNQFSNFWNFSFLN